MIQSFADETTERLWRGSPVRRIPVDLQRQALKRLGYLHAAQRLEDLYAPPSNHFHALAGSDRYAIRVNLQWRITFTWTPVGPADVLFEDYH
ncbi:MAG: type II toxin-antitoxin system RelE/ParE family toxin [Verrucomicrobia bacterium]|nr:type II toxin-antitoxin system RelE/ParE family toxin [Verrucomicrobiota bacterium]